MRFKIAGIFSLCCYTIPIPVLVLGGNRFPFQALAPAQPAPRGGDTDYIGWIVCRSCPIRGLLGVILHQLFTIAKDGHAVIVPTPKAVSLSSPRRPLASHAKGRERIVVEVAAIVVDEVYRVSVFHGVTAFHRLGFLPSLMV